MIKIKYFCEYPNLLPQLVQLWSDTIGKTCRPDVVPSGVEASFRQHLNKDALPLTYIALDGANVVGMCSLRSDDGLRSNLVPWLGSLCVAEDYRKRGIGKLLTQVVKEKARKMGFQKLYLFTFEKDLVDWYSSNGWTEVEKTIFKDKQVIVMKIDL